MFLLLATCIAQQPAANSGMVVFHRPKRYFGSGLTPSVYVDNREVARLDNGRFFSLTLAPGKHELSSSMKHAPLQVEVRPGEVIYLEMVILAGNWRGGGRLITTPQDDALIAIKKLKPLDKKWITDETLTFDLGEKMGAGDKTAATSAAAGATKICALDVTSSPDGAEVTVNGKFVGNTPAALRLAPGDHEIVVHKEGFPEWKRTVSATAGSSVRIVADLVASK
jgi:hypothetical protein